MHLPMPLNADQTNLTEQARKSNHASKLLVDSSARPASLSHQQMFCWIVVVIWTLIIGVIAVRTFLKPGSHSVYPVFLKAARNWLDGTDMYGNLDLDSYRYSPLLAILMAPFTLVPESIGNVVWRLINACVYLAAVACWSRILLTRKGVRTLFRSQNGLRAQATSPAEQGPDTFSPKANLAMIFLLIVPLSVGSLNNGQSNPLVIGLLLATVASAYRERWNLASVFLTGACLLKVYPIAVGLLLATIYPRQFTGRLLLALAIGLGLPFLFQQPEYVISQNIHWYHHLQTSDRLDRPLELWYRDLRLLCQVCHLPLNPRLYLGIQLLVAAGIAAICVAGKRAGWPRDRLLGTTLGLGCCWMTVFGSAAESCTYILLAPTLAHTFLEVFQKDFSRPSRALVIASYALFMVTEAAVWFPFGRQFHSLGVHAAAGLLLTIALIAMAFDRLWRKRIQESPGLARAA
jgi:hypothetical protein